MKFKWFWNKNVEIDTDLATKMQSVAKASVEDDQIPDVLHRFHQFIEKRAQGGYLYVEIYVDDYVNRKGDLVQMVPDVLAKAIEVLHQEGFKLEDVTIPGSPYPKMRISWFPEANVNGEELVYE